MHQHLNQILEIQYPVSHYKNEYPVSTSQFQGHLQTEGDEANQQYW